MFTDHLPGVYTPQVEDEAYFIFQAYEEIVGYYIYHFITLEDDRNKPMNDYFEKFMSKNLCDRNSLTHLPLKCKIIDLKYYLPSATTVKITEKLGTGDNNFTIQTEVTLRALEPEEIEGIEFSILYFNNSSLEKSFSMNYLVPSNEFEQCISEDELNNIHGAAIKPFDCSDPPLEILEISDFEPKLYSD